MSQLVEYADELVTKIGPRPGASKGEHQAAELIAQNFDELGLDAYIQEFNCARGIGWVRILYYLLATAAASFLFFMPEFRILAFILAVLSAALLALDLLDKNPLYNLINKGLSQNVVARYVPEGADPRRKVVIVAHYDSGRSMIQCMPFLANSYVLLRRIIRVSVVALLAVILLSLLPLPEGLALILGILGLAFGVIVLIAALAEIINLFLPYNQGANCNASGVAALFGVAQTLVGVRPSVFVGQEREAALRLGVRSGTNKRGSTRQQDDDDEALDGTVSRPAKKTGIGAAAGSLFSKARGLIGRQDGDEDDDSLDAQEDADYVDAVSDTEQGYVSSQGRKGRAGDDSDATHTGTRSSVRSVRATGATLRDVSQKSREAEAVLTGSIGGNLANINSGNGNNVRTGAVRPGGARQSSNPSIRTRPPLSLQQENEVVQTEAAQQRKSADSVPAWFANAKKKAAQKSESAAGKGSIQTDQAPTILRSQFADLPVSGADLVSKKPADDKNAATGSATSAGSGQTTDASQAARVDAQAIASSDTRTATPDARTAASDLSTVTKDAQTTSLDAQTTEHSVPEASVARTVQPDTDVPETARMTITDAPKTVQTNTQTTALDNTQTADHDATGQLERLFAKDRFSGRYGSSSDESIQNEPFSPDRHVSKDEQPATPTKADLSGLDRLTTGALAGDTIGQDVPNAEPLRRRVNLPQSASALEIAAATPSPEIPTNQRLRNLPKLSLGDSGAIPTQQAAIDETTPSRIDVDQNDTSRISTTGSFAPLGATGVMKPVGDELFDYHDTPQDIYVDDAEDGTAWQSDELHTGAVVAPQPMDIPQSRTRSFFGSLGDKLSGSGKNRKEELDGSPSSWLGVDEDFNARTEGSQIGSWDNFSEADDDDWKGGAYGGDSYEEDQVALQSFSSELIDKEVWVVALGSHENKNAGIKNFLAEHERELRNALIINLDGIGAGTLCYTVAEGSFRPHKTDHRLQNLLEAASSALGAGLEPVNFTGFNTDAAAALKSSSARAISIIGLDGALPLGWRWSDDRLDVLDEDNIQLTADLAVEVIKSS
ncbi:MAG: hypothetical protein LBC35_00615 [Coriobacteriales bacterium]|jgi:hypothetical protein|nr:hypothetical protein [Coriobacteriales bacterium]